MNVCMPAREGTDHKVLGALQFFALFHLNLAFSSIEEDDRLTVIERCYWPLLALAERFGPLGIEATGYTLEDINRRDPAWIEALRRLIAAGRVELIGSGQAQLIGPLVPARVVAANLAAGHEVYERLLGIRPRVALINEQAYSGGLVGHYLDAGYSTILVDWDNAATHHPEWDSEWRFAPQRALGNDGRSIGLLWTNTVAFQKLQRFAHDDIGLQDYLNFVTSHRGKADRTLCLYASDTEIFDFRPGRYRTEEPIGAPSEWERLASAVEAISEMEHADLISPSEAFAQGIKRGAESVLKVESPASPVPVKKQRKYNITRWAVSGRDDIAVNAACHRIYTALCERDAPAAEWKALCELWASDYRTHITDRRWKRYCAELSAMEERLGTSPHPGPPILGHAIAERFLTVETASLKACLDRRRGLAIQSLSFRGDRACVGGLSHGHFDDIMMQADWYTGDCVLEVPGEPKITDLEWADALIWTDAATGDTVVSGTIGTPIGRIEKVLRFHNAAPRVDFDLAFHWLDWGKASLRVGHVTLMPDAFDWGALRLTTHNGGVLPDEFALGGQTVDHGSSVSMFVTASAGFGMTEGWAEIGDDRHSVRIEVDRNTAPLLGMLTHKKIGGSLFCQIALSVLELDDTRKPAVYRAGGAPTLPRRARFSLVAGNGKAPVKKPSVK